MVICLFTTRDKAFHCRKQRNQNHKKRRKKKRRALRIRLASPLQTILGNNITSQGYHNGLKPINAAVESNRQVAFHPLLIKTLSPRLESRVRDRAGVAFTLDGMSGDSENLRQGMKGIHNKCDGFTDELL